MTTKSAAELYREKLLGVLKEHEKPMTIAELATKAGKQSFDTLRRHLNWLAGERKIIKLPGRGASFTYKYLPPVEKEIQAVTIREITSQQMASLLRSFAKRKWESSLVKSSRAIPYCIRKLYEYAHDAAHGGKRTQDDYDYIRSELQAFHDDLVNTLGTVRGLLETKELWDYKKSASWLLSSGGSADEYGQLSLEAQEVQQ